MQEIFVYAIVIAAAIYIGKMLWDAVAGRKSGCNSCSSNCASQEKTVLGKPVGNHTSDSNGASSSPLLQIELSSLTDKKDQ